MVSVEDKDPIGEIRKLELPSNLPEQYREDVYNMQKNTTKSFVFVINDQADSSRLQDTIQTLATEHSKPFIYEFRMSGLLKPDEKPPAFSNWRDYVDLDQRYYQPDTKYGQLFLKDDRKMI